MQSIRKYDVATQDIILSFVNSATLGIYRQWIRDGKKIPVNEIIKMTTDFIKPGVDNLLKQK